MNMTRQQGEWNILEDAQTPTGPHSWMEGIHSLVRKAGEQASRISRATAAIFSRRQHASSLRVIWAGVLRSDSDRLIPEPSEEVRFQVANQMFLCEEGKPLVFDDSWNQGAWDEMNGYRVVFLTDSATAVKEPLYQRLQQFITRLVRL